MIPGDHSQGFFAAFGACNSGSTAFGVRKVSTTLASGTIIRMRLRNLAILMSRG
jgi:hypothetical protein